MRSKNWFWGVFFVLAGVFVIGSQLGAFGEIGFLSILASVLLIALIVHSAFQLNFFGVLIPAAFLYTIYNDVIGLPEISVWQLVLAAVLASTGLSILFHRHVHKVWVHHNHGSVHHGKAAHHAFTSEKEKVDDNNPYVKVNFGSSSKYLHADSLKSGEFICSFGSLQIYFDQVQLSPGGAEILVDCSFGQVELFLPRQWKVINRMYSTLGNVEDNRRDNPAENAPELTLKGNLSFGSVEIRYI